MCFVRNRGGRPPGRGGGIHYLRPGVARAPPRLLNDITFGPAHEGARHCAPNETSPARRGDGDGALGDLLFADIGESASWCDIAGTGRHKSSHCGISATKADRDNGYEESALRRLE